MYVYEWCIFIGILVFIAVVCLTTVPCGPTYHGDDEGDEYYDD